MSGFADIISGQQGQAAPAAPTPQPGNVRMLIAAPYSDVHPLITAFPPSGSRGLAALSVTGDCSTVYRDAVEMDVGVVLLSPHIQHWDVEVVQRLRQYEKHPIVVIALVPDGEWAATLERAGAAAHLASPATPDTADKLVGMVPGLIQAAYQERTSALYIPRLDAQTAAAIASKGYKKRVVASYSPKGGCGKTTLAVNLAALLGIVANRPTLLVDLNMNGGHVAVHLGLRDHDRTLYTLARAFMVGQNKMSPKLVREHLTHVTGSLDVIPGIDRMEMAGEQYLAGKQGADFAADLLQSAYQMYDFVVLDMGSSYNNALHRQALRDADLILMLVTADATSIMDAAKALETMKQFMSITDDNFQMVVNFWTHESGLRQGDLAGYVGLCLYGIIPFEPSGDLIHCVNTGHPYVVSFYNDPKRRREDPVLKALIHIAAAVYPPIETIAGLDESKKQSGLRGWLGI
ncbi:MAG: AAA family ATPase [Anaerolineae bacterium]|nr:AAA family ATPase [Anaerolineae bacterium]